MIAATLTHIIRPGLGCVVAVACAGVVQAGTLGGPVGPPVRLDQLLGPNGGSIQVDDKLFDDFAYSWTGDMPSPDRVNVSPYVDGSGHPGISFTGAFQDLPGDGGSDAQISYSVWVVHPDPNVRINDVHLYGQLNVVGGPGNISITESFPSAGSEFLSILFENPPGTQEFTDWTFLDEPTRHLRVAKDILGNATGTSGLAAVTIINQTFSQIIIPEPGACAIALMAAACVVIRRTSGRL